jgi:FlaA1/EpsC-like NDP-sugar epimerase
VNTTKTSELLKSFLVRVAAARVAILLVFHTFVFTACYVIAWMVRFEFRLPQQHVGLVQSSLPYVVLIQLLVAISFGFLRGWWRYVGIADVLRLVAGTVTALIVLNVLWYVVDATQYGPLAGVSRGVLLVDWAFSLLALFGARVLVRLGKDFARLNDESSDVRNVLIIGAGDAGEALVREIQHRPQLGIRVLGFVDDHRVKWNSNIRGIKVRGPISRIGAIADESGANEALLAIPSANGKRMREIVRQLVAAELKFRTIPGMDQLVSGKVHVTQLRTVNVDDLLRRSQVIVSADRVRAFFNSKKIVITGAGGSIGSELAVQVLQYEPEELHLIERSETALYEILRRVAQEASVPTKVVSHLLDCADSATLLAEVRPDIVIHAAAHKHVPMGEENPLEYIRNNAVVARRFADACEAAGVQRFVFISTDKAIRPSSVMGASKRAAEIALLDLARRSAMKMMVVRFGNVIGSSGSVVPLFLQQIAAGGPVTVTHPEVTRYFLRTSEAISLILQAAALGEDGKVYMLDMGEPIRIAELARDLIQLSNHALDDIPIVFTGLRPGEKLHEEIRSSGDATFATEHPHIIGIEVPQPPEMEVDLWFRELERSIHAQSPQIFDVLTRLIPEYAAPAMPPPVLTVVQSETADRRLVN